MFLYGYDIFAENICFYGGITGADRLDCITEEDYDEDYQMFPIEGQMIRTRQVVIEFNQAEWGIVRELEIDYCIGSRVECPGE